MLTIEITVGILLAWAVIKLIGWWMNSAPIEREEKLIGRTLYEKWHLE